MTCRSGNLFLMYLIMLIWKMELPCDESCRDKHDITVSIRKSLAKSIVRAAVQPMTNY